MRRVLRRTTWAAVLFVVLLPAARLWACYAVVVGRQASADGSVLVGHNEENGGRRVLLFRVVPAREFAAGAVARLRRGGTLPQVPKTCSYLWSEIPGLEFSDAYLNQHGVAVVSDACPTREEGYEALVARGEIRHGGIGYMLRRLVAERARSARHGVELAGGLIERFGYVASGRTYVIADPREAWLVAVVRGRRWVAQRVPDDRVVLLPNVHIIDRVDLGDRHNFMASPDIVSYAVARGWYDPASDGPFRFAPVYGDPSRERPDLRRLRGRQRISGRAEEPTPNGLLHFGVRPSRPVTVADVARVLRDRRSRRPISSPWVQEGAVFQLRDGMPRWLGCIYWRATAEPATSVFTPWYLGILETPPAYDHPAARQAPFDLQHHFHPSPQLLAEDPRMAWWIFKGLQDRVHEDLPGRLQTVASRWAEMEQLLLERQASVEERARELARNDPPAARRYLTRYCAQAAAEACEQARRLSDLLAGR